MRLIRQESSSFDRIIILHVQINPRKKKSSPVSMTLLSRMYFDVSGIRGSCKANLGIAIIHRHSLSDQLARKNFLTFKNTALLMLFMVFQASRTTHHEISLSVRNEVVNIVWLERLAPQTAVRSKTHSLLQKTILQPLDNHLKSPRTTFLKISRLPLHCPCVIDMD